MDTLAECLEGAVISPKGSQLEGELGALQCGEDPALGSRGLCHVESAVTVMRFAVGENRGLQSQWHLA
jgi:hypothetical protein